MNLIKDIDELKLHESGTMHREDGKNFYIQRLTDTNFDNVTEKGDIPVISSTMTREDNDNFIESSKGDDHGT